MKLKILILLILFSTSSCASSRVLDVKSPCVSGDGGPCGVRKPINDWWLKQNSLKS